jgi:hypothetical protein
VATREGGVSVWKRGGKWCASIYNPAPASASGSARSTARRARAAPTRRSTEAKRGSKAAGVGDDRRFAARWMDDYPRRKESTTAHYRQQIKALADEFGHLRLDQLDRPTAREFAQRSSTWPAAGRCSPTRCVTSCASATRS